MHMRDDGKGIDREVLSADGREGHFGLHGMRERAQLVGGKLVVWSELESGTEIELSLPASRAYIRLCPASLGISQAFKERLRCKREEQLMSSEQPLIRILVVDDHPVVRQALPYWSAPKPT
jgi:hypothetical protein